MKTKIADNSFFIASCFLFVFAPLYFQFNVGSKGINLPFNHAVWLGASLVVLISALTVLINKKSIIMPKYWLALVAAPGLLILLGFFSNPINMEEWWLRVGFITGGVAFVFSLFQFNLNQNNIKLILYSLVLSALLQGFIGLTQIYQVRALHGWFPWSHDQRPYGIFQQVNLYASFLATGALIALHLIYSNQLDQKSQLMKGLLTSSAIFLATMIIASGSRIGLVSLFIGAMLILRDQIPLLVKNKGKVCVLFLLILAVISYLPSGGVNLFKEKFGSTESRFAIYDITLDLIKQKPLTGHGIGSFERLFQEYRADYEYQFPHHELDKRKYTHPHNEILYWVVETGVVSLLGFILLIGAIIKQLYSIGPVIRTHYLALILPISLHAMIEFPFYSSSLHWFVWLWFVFLIFDYSKRT